TRAHRTRVRLHFTVGDEIRFLQILQLEFFHGARQFIAHGLHDDVFGGENAGDAKQGGSENFSVHGDSPVRYLSSKGGARMGESSWDLTFFWTSIWLISNPG